MSTKGSTMRQQLPAQAVIEKLLRIHATTQTRSWFGRLFGYSPLSDDSVSWYQGAKGEIIVGRLVSTLPPEWIAFHALPVGVKGADIDHLVIGPGGVFTINTKYHKNRAVWVAGRGLLVSGQRQPYIRNAEFEATRVTRLLRKRMPHLAPVRPIIAVVSPKSLTVKKEPDQVKVLTHTALRRWLLKRRPVLTPDELNEIAVVIDDPTTWPPPVFPPADGSRERFEELDAKVRAAHLLRALWKLLVAVALCGAILAAFQFVVAMVGGYIATQ